MICLSLIGLALGGCRDRDHYAAVSSHCNTPRIPPVGTSGFVTATPLPDISGYRADFHLRQWQATHVDVYPSPLGGLAVVVPAVPYPALLVRTKSGHRVTLPLLVLGCG